jgi:hypothetical protein
VVVLVVARLLPSQYCVPIVQSPVCAVCK